MKTTDRTLNQPCTAWTDKELHDARNAFNRNMLTQKTSPEVIKAAASTMRAAADDLDRTARTLRRTGHSLYATRAVEIISALQPKLNVDLIVTKAVQEAVLLETLKMEAKTNVQPRITVSEVENDAAEHRLQVKYFANDDAWECHLMLMKSDGEYRKVHADRILIEVLGARTKRALSSTGKKPSVPEEHPTLVVVDGQHRQAVGADEARSAEAIVSVKYHNSKALRSLHNALLEADGEYRKVHDERIAIAVHDERKAAEERRVASERSEARLLSENKEYAALAQKMSDIRMKDKHARK